MNFLAFVERNWITVIWVSVLSFGLSFADSSDAMESIMSTCFSMTCTLLLMYAVDDKIHEWLDKK
ncbi:hypothetical protein IGA_05626 [Bacillus cereus HuA3-9]|uniref:Uncharacterized protein n=1 Tax=Bacillus cereus HuA3-9 TaxID=1053205 RepID=R8CIH4_BACCE|nr:hypothetical protein IGA_05626 [Bacillus cereus HuA3-9]